MYSHIVWLTDFSIHATAGRSLVATLAAACGAKVTALHARSAAAALEETAWTMIQSEARALEAEGIDATAALMAARPVEAIRRFSDAVDLIVVGRTGKAGLDRVLLGSTTKRILEGSDRSVLVAGGRLPERIQTILCPVAPSAVLAPQIEQAVGLARAAGARCVFLSVYPGLVVLNAEQELQRLQDAVAAVGVEGVSVDYRLLAATTVEEGIRQAAVGCDLMVTGNRRHSGLARVLLGSVSADMAASAPAPVLVAR